MPPTDEHAPEQRSVWRDFLPLGSVATAATFGPPLGALLLVGLIPVLAPWLQAQQALGVAIYVAAFVVLAGLALLPTYAQAVLGGWAFGFGLGFAASLVGFAGASLLGYAIAQRLTGRRLMEVIHRRPQWVALHQALTASGWWRTVLVVVLLRLPPTSPFALTNVLLASARVPWGPYLLGTVVGLSPRIAVTVFAAAGLATLEFDGLSPRPSDRSLLIAIVLTVAALIVLGLVARQALRRIARAPVVVGEQTGSGTLAPAKK